MLIFRVTHGLMLGQHYELRGDQAHQIGRNEGALTLLDDKISRAHAELRLRDDHWFIQDLESTNGTFVNGQRIVETTQLAEKDVIQVGMTVLLVEAVTSVVAKDQDRAVQQTTPPAPYPRPVSTTATQPIQRPFPSAISDAGTGAGDDRATGPGTQAAFTGPVTPAAWALIGYSILAVAGVLLDIVLA